VAVPASEPLRLVAIADTLRDGLDELVARSRMAIEAGATAVHVRLKGEDSRTLLDACRALVVALPVPVVVHDRADVATAAGAAGVHLSPEEMPPAVVRRIGPPGMLVGVSIGGLADVELGRDADYVSIGPVFSRGARVSGGDAMGIEEFTRLTRMMEVPVVAVGGIAADNARSVLDAGAAGVAVITGAYAKAQAAQAIRDLRAASGT
jgi:thiamine-phosphate pyrophosphorylase